MEVFFILLKSFQESMDTQTHEKIHFKYQFRAWLVSF